MVKLGIFTSYSNIDINHAINYFDFCLHTASKTTAQNAHPQKVVWAGIISRFVPMHVSAKTPLLARKTTGVTTVGGYFSSVVSLPPILFCIADCQARAWPLIYMRARVCVLLITSNGHKLTAPTNALEAPTRPAIATYGRRWATSDFWIEPYTVRLVLLLQSSNTRLLAPVFLLASIFCSTWHIISFQTLPLTLAYVEFSHVHHYWDSYCFAQVTKPSTTAFYISFPTRPSPITERNLGNTMCSHSSLLPDRSQHGNSRRRAPQKCQVRRQECQHMMNLGMTSSFIEQLHPKPLMNCFILSVHHCQSCWREHGVGSCR